MESRAVAKFVRISPRKADRVLRLIRGKGVSQAQEILTLTTRPIAVDINKILKSAVANAVHRDENIDPESLSVKMAVAGAGPTLKRIRPRAQRRANRILKRTSHITIVVGDE